MDDWFGSFFGIPRRNRGWNPNSDDPVSGDPDPLAGDHHWFDAADHPDHPPPPVFDFTIRVEPWPRPGAGEEDSGVGGLFDFGMDLPSGGRHGGDIFDQLEQRLQSMFAESFLGGLGRPGGPFERFGGGGGMLPGGPADEGGGRGGGGGVSGAREPRDQMLRQPDSHTSHRHIEDRQAVSGRLWSPSARSSSSEQTPAPQRDTDLDGEVTSGNIDTFVSPPSPSPSPSSPPPPAGQRNYNYSFQTFQHAVNSNGHGQRRSERHHTVTDQSGVTESTVTRVMGDRQHVVVTRRAPDGREERSDRFVNMSEGDLAEFDSAWSEGGRGGGSGVTFPSLTDRAPPPSPQPLLRQNTDTTDTLDTDRDSLFKKFFGNYLYPADRNKDKKT